MTRFQNGFVSLASLSFLIGMSDCVLGMDTALEDARRTNRTLQFPASEKYPFHVTLTLTPVDPSKEVKVDEVLEKLRSSQATPVSEPQPEVSMKPTLAQIYKDYTFAMRAEKRRSDEEFKRDVCSKVEELATADLQGLELQMLIKLVADLDDDQRDNIYTEVKAFMKPDTKSYDVRDYIDGIKALTREKRSNICTKVRALLENINHCTYDACRLLQRFETFDDSQAEEIYQEVMLLKASLKDPNDNIPYTIHELVKHVESLKTDRKEICDEIRNLPVKGLRISDVENIINIVRDLDLPQRKKLYTRAKAAMEKDNNWKVYNCTHLLHHFKRTLNE